LDVRLRESETESETDAACGSEIGRQNVHVYFLKNLCPESPVELNPSHDLFSFWLRNPPGLSLLRQTASPAKFRLWELAVLQDQKQPFSAGLQLVGRTTHSICFLLANSVEPAGAARSRLRRSAEEASWLVASWLGNLWLGTLLHL